jgi:hypothetical protein
MVSLVHPVQVVGVKIQEQLIVRREPAAGRLAQEALQASGPAARHLRRSDPVEQSFALQAMSIALYDL